MAHSTLQAKAANSAAIACRELMSRARTFDAAHSLIDSISVFLAVGVDLHQCCIAAHETQSKASVCKLQQMQGRNYLCSK